MDSVLESIKSKFLSELDSDRGLWRIYRRNTFIDLIVKDFVKFQESNETDLLIDMFNNVIKMRMQQELNKIDLTQNLDSLKKTFDQHDKRIIQLYTQTLNSIATGLDHSNPGTIANNALYFKVAANLNLDEYNEQVFDELLSDIYSFLSRNAK